MTLGQDSKETNPKIAPNAPQIAGKPGSLVVYHGEGSTSINFTDLKSDLELVTRVAEILNPKKEEEK